MTDCTFGSILPKNWPLNILKGLQKISLKQSRHVTYTIQAADKTAILYGTCEEIKNFHGRYKSEFVVYNVSADSEMEVIDSLGWLKNNT